MNRSIVGAALLLALAWPAPAAAADDMRFAIRAEAGGTVGWSGRNTVGGGGRLSFRSGSVTGGLTVDGNPSAPRAPTMVMLVRADAGLATDVGDWEASGTAFLSLRGTSYPDLVGAQRADVASLGVGLRAGLGRYFGGPERGGKFVPWLGFSASVGVGPPTRYRLQEQRQTGFLALFSVTVGAGFSVRGLLPGTDATP